MYQDVRTLILPHPLSSNVGTALYTSKIAETILAFSWIMFSIASFSQWIHSKHMSGYSFTELWPWESQIGLKVQRGLFES